MSLEAEAEVVPGGSTDPGGRPNGLQNEAEIGLSQRLHLASCYLNDAFHGRNVDFVPRPYEIKLYSLYKHPLGSKILLVVYLVYLGLALFEPPTKNYFQLPFWVTVLVESLCLVFFLARFFHSFMFSEFRSFYRDTKHVLLGVLLVLNILDICVFTFFFELGKGHLLIRWTRPLRPFVIVNFPECRQVRQGFRNIRRTLPEVVNVLFLFFANVALFALMGFKLFGTKRNEFTKASGPYFDNYLDSFWDLYVLVTTANHPDIMMPAYDKSRWFVLFFIAYLVINLYMFMSVFLAVVYNRFKSNLKHEVRENATRSEELLSKVFTLVSQNNTSMEEKSFKQLMNLTLSTKQPNYVECLCLVLDPSRSGHISRDSFMDLLSLLKLAHTDQAQVRPVLVERLLPGLYQSRPSKLLRKLVRHKYFRTTFDLVILLNAVFIALDLDGGEYYFLMLFTLEIVLKMYTFGFVAFFKKMWNTFDVVVVGSALACTAINLMQDDGEDKVNLDFLMVLRVTRIFKIFHSVPRFRIVLNTLLHILPSLATYGSVLFIIYYFFAIIGMELFAGKIQGMEADCGNFRLRDSAFSAAHYCNNNFNDLVSAFVILFELMVVNQWHVLAQGHVLVTSAWAKLYFLAFHIVCVIIILNIFTAFVLEVFILEYKVAGQELGHGPSKTSQLHEKICRMGLGFSGQKEPVISVLDLQGQDMSQLFEVVDADHDDLDRGKDQGEDQGVENETDGPGDFSLQTTVRFHLTRKSRSVQELLEKMFERDL